MNKRGKRSNVNKNHANLVPKKMIVPLVFMCAVILPFAIRTPKHFYLKPEASDQKRLTSRPLCTKKRGRG